MTEPKRGTSRRDFLKTTGTVAAASALAGVAVPSSTPARTTRSRSPWSAAAAAAPAPPPTPCRPRAARSSSSPWPTSSRTGSTTATTSSRSSFGDKVDVPDDRKFIGFDGYKKAMDCLKPGDVVILATPPAFRWVHFTYAIEKGLNVFMEKPVTVDGPTTRKMLALGEEAKKKNLKVGVGLMCRHCEAREELFDRIKDGADRRHHHCCGPTARPARSARRSPRPSPTTSASCCTRSASSTASSGPAAAATATS